MTEIPTVHYLNTDLDLICDVEPRLLTEKLSVGDIYCHLTKGEDALWYVLCEDDSDTEPELNLVRLLDAIESLSDPARSLWDRCTLREFNIGYDCGDQPWAFNQGISNKTLSRMAACGASFRITLYPAEGRHPRNPKE